MFPLEIYPKVAGTDGIIEIFIVIAAYFGKDGNIPHCVLAWDKAESIEPGVVGLILWGYLRIIQAQWNPNIINTGGFLPDLVRHFIEIRVRKTVENPPLSADASEVMFEGVRRKENSTSHTFGFRGKYLFWWQMVWFRSWTWVDTIWLTLCLGRLVGKRQGERAGSLDWARCGVQSPQKKPTLFSLLWQLSKSWAHAHVKFLPGQWGNVWEELNGTLPQCQSRY